MLHKHINSFAIGAVHANSVTVINSIAKENNTNIKNKKSGDGTLFITYTGNTNIPVFIEINSPAIGLDLGTHSVKKLKF
jgi:hypothetical protein